MIDRGAQNLAGNWESRRYNLFASFSIAAIPTIVEFETAVVMHNDAVVQGLSEVPTMQDVEKMGYSPSGRGSETHCLSTERQRTAKGRPRLNFTLAVRNTVGVFLNPMDCSASNHLSERRLDYYGTWPLQLDPGVCCSPVARVRGRLQGYHHHRN